MSTLLFLAVTAAFDSAYALDTTRDIKQFKHTAWTSEDGAPAAINVIAQSNDGYLWLGTATGLYRFDGVTFEQISASDEMPRRSDFITALLGSASGEIWVGHYWGGVSVYKDGRLRSVNQPPPRGAVRRIAQDREGNVWVATDGVRLAGLWRHARGKWEVVDEGWGLPKEHLSTLLVTRDGTLWVALRNSLLQLTRGARHFAVYHEQFAPDASLAEASDGTIWVSDAFGIRKLQPRSGAPRAPRAGQNDNRVNSTYSLIFDRDGSLWATNNLTGAVRLRDPQRAPQDSDGTVDASAEVFATQDGLTPGALLSVAEDREGNVWIGTTFGLNRFRPTNVVTPLKSGGNSDANSLVATSRHGVVYGSVEGSPHLFRVEPGASFAWSPPVSQALKSLCSDHNGGIWAGAAEGHLSRWVGDRVDSVLMPAGAESASILGCAQDKNGTLWVSIDGFGLYRYDGNTWSRFDVSADMRGIWPWSLATDSRGRVVVYFGTRSLMRIDDGRVETLWSKDDITIGLINVIYRSADALFLGGEFGLARFDGRNVKALLSRDFGFLSHVSGIARTSSGQTWLIGSSGIVSLRSQDLDAVFDGERRELHPQIFDAQDGAHGAPLTSPANNAAEDEAGRLWFATIGGIAMIDPARLHRNSTPPTVLIRSLSAGSTSYAASGKPTLPSGTSNLQIAYTATSLSIPERVRFRYKLSGVDSHWIDPGQRRQAYYTNLSPGHYQFQVIAANNDGVWNTSGATLDFVIPPTFFQSSPFLVLCILATIALLSALYNLRLQQVARRLQMRSEERLVERERIARELHDTLLQGFQALVLRFQNIVDRMPPNQATRQLMEQELDRADAVLVEGRDRVRNLRVGDAAPDLRQVFLAAAEQMRADSATQFRLDIEGERRELHPVVADEIAKIGTEALCNAFTHAAACKVELGIAFRRARLLLTISDDGVGIPSTALEARGCEGHFGLMGMRERARRIQGALSVKSVAGAGTVIALTVPGAVAYASQRRRRATIRIFWRRVREN